MEHFLWSSSGSDEERITSGRVGSRILFKTGNRLVSGLARGGLGQKGKTPDVINMITFQWQCPPCSNRRVELISLKKHGKRRYGVPWVE
jgi:hypothetical protein